MATPALLIFAWLLLGFAFCEDTQCSAKEMFQDNLKKLAVANNHFAFKVFRKLTQTTDGNTFISPFTISSVLTMLYKGARGEAAQELRKLLGFRRAKLEDSVIFNTTHHFLVEVLEKTNSNIYTINCASALIVDCTYPLRPEYKDDIQELYHAYIQEADLSKDGAKIVKEMNSWVKVKSRGNIKSLADSINPGTALLLISAAYFKGSWRLKFEPEDTIYYPFYNGGNILDRSDVLMMRASATYRFYEEEGFFSAVELAYDGKDISMIIFLPEEIDEIDEMEQDLSPSRIAHIRRNMHFTKVDLTIPKFKLGFNSDLSKELLELGLTKVFDSGADLSGMMEDRQVPILEEVRHKAMMKIDEEGSVAAAISSVLMTRMIQSTDPVSEFYVDHPFLFAVVDTRNGLILFMGRVNKL